MGIKVSGRNFAIQVERRSLETDALSAEPKHTYKAIITTRASVKTRSGLSEFARVEINGKMVTHVFNIRWTSIPFDVRDRIRDATGNLYTILSVDNVDEANREMRINCASQGMEDVEAAR
jgi:hypothetical protein